MECRSGGPCTELTLLPDSQVVLSKVTNHPSVETSAHSHPATGQFSAFSDYYPCGGVWFMDSTIWAPHKRWPWKDDLMPHHICVLQISTKTDTHTLSCWQQAWL